MRVIRQKGDGAKKLEKLLNDIDKKVGKVGWFDTAKYPNGTSVAYVAAIQEFGVPEKNIPPRLGMRTTIKLNAGVWRDTTNRLVKKMLKDDLPVDYVFETIGLKAAGDFKKTIKNVVDPPIKEKTIEARQRKYADKKTEGLLSKPLIDTKILFNSLTNIVETKE
jgi:hypothetical protein